VELTLVSISGLVRFSFSKKLSDIFFRAADKLIENFWSIDNLGFFAIQNFGNFTSNQCLACSWRSVENHAFTVFHAVFLYHRLGVAPGVECTSKDFCKFFVKTSDSEILEVEI